MAAPGGRVVASELANGDEALSFNTAEMAHCDARMLQCTKYRPVPDFCSPPEALECGFECAGVVESNQASPGLMRAGFQPKALYT
ncbi:hypothetical protein LMG18096_02597 [Ralstonia holmesii]|uniref:Uncharacterized protein n=1 Tax=Ralstonia holmesii TaxID=3058602 RepID=A0ABC8QDB4_9RALS|nr:hypothetical protein LMG18096_02597 [Ralstonia sp. LMG 32967]CAJ0816516.1 hypothetical protein LMG18093_03044 [Ralstonia sp. LMG 32967]